jgi:glycosyltransferase involved in cell wall biosynthesis
MDMIKLSVIICSHSPRREYLERTLAGLKAQTLAKDAWELILVDNASKPPIAEGFDLSWHPQGRHVVEANLGVIHARQRSVAEMRGQWLVFVDDDNVLAEDYLTRVLAIITAGHPRLALFGAGVMKPEFEIPPPAELKSLLSLLALRDVDAPRRSRDPKESAAVPCGAGMCARRDIAGRFAALVEEINKRVVLGRKGTELFSHEDDIFSWAAAQAGMEFGVFPELRMTHLIGARRLT